MTDPARILNLGCGRRHVAGGVNVDITSDTNPDIVHDLDVLPWPLPNDTFREVQCYDVVEHLQNVIATMEQIHRVCEHGAVVTITVPHFSSPNAFTDPTHRHYFGWFSFHYVTGEHQFSFYTRSRFRRRKSHIVFAQTLLNKVVRRLANRWPAEYERRWAWMFPAWFLSFELEVIKEGLAPAASEPTDFRPR